MESNKSLKEAAKAYEGKSTGNIADLPKVSTDLKLEDRESVNDKQEKYTYQVIIIEGQEYRVPASVLKSLKAILEENPNLASFKVKKSGQGFDTTYTVIPLG